MGASTTSTKLGLFLASFVTFTALVLSGLDEPVIVRNALGFYFARLIHDFCTKSQYTVFLTRRARDDFSVH